MLHRVEAKRFLPSLILDEDNIVIEIGRILEETTLEKAIKKQNSM